MKLLMTCVLAAMLAGLTVPAIANSVALGDFQTGLGDWMTDGPVSISSGVAVLEENPSGLMTSLWLEFAMPAQALSLSFHSALTASPDGSGGFPLPDTLQVSLLRPGTYEPILSTAGFSDFYGLDNTGDSRFGPLVMVADTEILLNVSSVPSGTEAVLFFDLLGGGDGMATRVEVDDVIIMTGVIPEPLTLSGVWLGVLSIAGYLRRRRRHE